MARGDQGALFTPTDPPAATEAPCPACGGIGTGCTCSRTGAEALSLL